MGTEETKIRELIAQWHAATARGDVDAVLPLMAEDVQFLVPGKEPMTGRETFAAGLRGLLRTHRLTSSADVREVQVSGDLAFAVSALTVRISALGSDQEAVRNGMALSVFGRQSDGRWQLIRDANLLPSADGPRADTGRA